MINIQDNIAEMSVGNISIGSAYVGNQLVWEKSSPVLPYDAQVEWLSSTGGQYISLPMSVPAGTFFELEFDCVPIYFSTTNTRYAIFGGTPWKQCLCYFYSGSASSITFASYMGNSSSNGGIAVVPEVKNHVVFSTTHLETSTSDGYISNKNVSRPLTAAINGFYLFCGYRYPTARYPIRYCNCKITAGTNVLYDLIAVRKDGVGYMYDKISKELYGNAGSGSFTYGDDIT